MGVCALSVPVSARASLRVCAGVYNVCVFFLRARVVRTYACVCVSVFASMRVRVCACASVCACLWVVTDACVRVRACVTLDLKDNKGWPAWL